MNNTEDRQRVRTLLNVNMVVEAGAGTGKTTLLIDRLCFALLAQGILVPRLVALTFTEKAAAEIKTRLISKLQEVLRKLREKENKTPANAPAQPKDAQQQNNKEDTLETLQKVFQVPEKVIISRAETALSQLDVSPIGTIHSFCADILRSYPLEAGLTPGAEIDKGPRAKRIFQAQWNHFLDVELGENAPRAPLWQEVLSKVSLADLRACAEEMCRGKVQNPTEQLPPAFLASLCSERAQRARELAESFSAGKKAPRVIEKALQQAALRFDRAACWLRSGQYEPAEEETIAIKSVPQDWDAQSEEEAKSLCRFAAQADPAVQIFVQKAYELLRHFVQTVRARFEAEGILSFDDLLVKTRDLLKNNLLVRRYIQEEYDALYIDEFQDTDPVQGELLLFLAEQKGGRAACWQEVKLQPGKLFVVGDPKQSIYRFRGADITAYELFTDLILQQGGEKAYLRKNFRSEQEIISLANGVCSVVMTAKPAFQPAYEPIFTDKMKRNGAAELVLVENAPEKAAADDYRHNQGRFVAQWIEQNVGRLTLHDGHKLRYKDIALLTRAATTLGPYAEALRRAGIAFSLEEDKDFYHRQEINDFLNLLRVIDDPLDRISLTGVLRSPLGTLTDEEIYRLAAAGGLDWRKPAPIAAAERLFVLVRKYAQRAGREPLPRLLHSLLEESLLAEACTLAYDAQRSISYLEKLVALAESRALQTPLTLGQFLSRVQEMMEQELSRLSALPAGEGGDAVNVMTVHKSKGLQFPVVILVDVSKKESVAASKRPAHLYSWRHHVHGFRVGSYGDICLAWLEEEQKEHARCEEVRILYVALTRAQEKLLVVGNAQCEPHTSAEMFARAGFFPPQGQCPDTLGAEQCLRVTYIPYQKPEDFVYSYRAAAVCPPQNKQLQQWSQRVAARRAEYIQLCSAPYRQTPSALAEETVADFAAAQLGTLIHAALARSWSEQKLPAGECVRRAVRETGLGNQAEEAAAILKTFFQCAVYRELRALEVLGIEVPFSQCTAGTVVSGVIDLLAQDQQGNIWVLDFKTDRADINAAYAQKYRPQLQAYTQAARHMYPQAVICAAVVFVRAGKRIVLEESGAGNEIAKI